MMLGKNGLMDAVGEIFEQFKEHTAKQQSN